MYTSALVLTYPLIEFKFTSINKLDVHQCLCSMLHSSVCATLEPMNQDEILPDGELKHDLVRQV